MRPGALDNRRKRMLREAEALLRRHELICILTCQERPELHADRESIRRQLASATKAQVRTLLERIEAQYIKLRRYYGFSASPSDEEWLWSGLFGAPEERPHPMLPLWVVRTFIARFDRVLADIDDYPAHTRIQFYSSDHEHSTIQTWILEAALFEELAALFNLTSRTRQAADPMTIDKVQLKTTSGLMHSCITISFNFLEAYLNGIAADFLACPMRSLTEEERTKLTEFDAAQGRPRPLSMREKILQYPKIIGGHSHPPIQESNSATAAFLIREVKALRDSFVHASPARDVHSLDFAKEEGYLGVSYHKLERTVDSVIALTRELNDALGRFTRRLWWLHDRRSDGLFDDSVFD